MRCLKNIYFKNVFDNNHFNHLSPIFNFFLEKKWLAKIVLAPYEWFNLVLLKNRWEKGGVNEEKKSVVVGFLFNNEGYFRDFWKVISFTSISTLLLSLQLKHGR